MPSTTSHYDFIISKINAMKSLYPLLRDKKESYVFSALCVKSVFYKNPSLSLADDDLIEIVVDSQYDGGVDLLLSDPNSETSDLIIGQSKLHTSISMKEITDAVKLMAQFYKDMSTGHFEKINSSVQARFLTLNSEVGDESKIHFVFFTSASQNRISPEQITRKFKEEFTDSDNVDLQIYFASDIVEEIKEAESRRPTIEKGKIVIDHKDNILSYGDEEEAIIVNVSAYSIKQLYAQYSTCLLSRNLRYHVKGPDIDRAISETIKNDPHSFWFMNNGLTIICDRFEISGKEIKLYEFSIINGGQTTYMIHKSDSIIAGHDFYLPCKIIRTIGESPDKRNSFILKISKATNTQKPIKPVDLKSNTPEQIRFAYTMREAGIFYETKRGEVIPKNYKMPYLNTDLGEVGRLCLAGLFQMPGTSRNKPSSLYLPKYYNLIFNGNQNIIANLCKELLYINYYFQKKFIKNYDSRNKQQPNAERKMIFAHNSRTVCIAFASLAGIYKQGALSNQQLERLFRSINTELCAETAYDVFRGIDLAFPLLKKGLFENKDKYDETLDQLFNAIIKAGFSCYCMASRNDATLTENSYLKKDKNYYEVLQAQWEDLYDTIRRVFG